MIAEGAFVQVRETRTMFQDWMRPHLKVSAFFSQVTHDPDMAVELFVLEPANASRTDA